MLLRNMSVWACVLAAACAARGEVGAEWREASTKEEAKRLLDKKGWGDVVAVSEGMAGVGGEAREGAKEWLEEQYGAARAAQEAKDTLADAAWVKRAMARYRGGRAEDTARWDGVVEGALDGLSRREADGAALEKAVSEGCGEPLVKCLHYLNRLEKRSAGAGKEIAKLKGAVAALEASAHGDGTKYLVHDRLMGLMVGNEQVFGLSDQKTREAVFRASVKELPAYVRERPSEKMIRWTTKRTFNLIAGTFKTRGEGYALLAEGVAQAKAPEGVRLRLEAEFRVKSAWDERGSGWASSVTPEGWAGFRRELALAETAAVKGWRLDPLMSDCARLMITVTNGLQRDEAEIEQWFERAVLAEPERADTYRERMNFLQPKWGGSVEELLALGKECGSRATGENELGEVQLECVRLAAEASPDPEAFLKREEVWMDVEGVLGKMLETKDEGKRRRYRAEHVRWAVSCSQWARVLELMKQYGDTVDLATFGGKDLYAYYRRRAGEELAKKPV